MDKPVENISYHRPEWDEQGRPYYTAITYPQSENHKAVLLKLADRIIPVIFIPGVMGSNLKNENGEVWQSSATSFSKWLFANPQKRKDLLDPKTTQVDVSGKIRNESGDGNRFPSRRTRGWGSALFMSYGESLDKLQYMLNDDEVLLDKYFCEEIRQTLRQRIIGVSLGAEVGEEPLTDEEIWHSFRFAYPLHVFGYNWLQSNADSAKLLQDYIAGVFRIYAGRLACHKVILITHSMGGLVARHYSENMGGQNSILGIIHGVMPDLGSPTAYRRMKTGERGISGAIIGESAKSLMPVLAQSPGPLQLLPGTAYGPGWLKIVGSAGTQSLPKSDPYTEIYLNQTDWWRLYEAGISGGRPEDEWEEYKTTIETKVKKFIEKLSGKYHPQTWAFYGASEKNRSDDVLIWHEHSVRGTAFGYPEFIQPTERLASGKLYRLSSAGGPGDGTVPLKSGHLPSHRVMGLLASDVDHEAAYAFAPVNRDLSVFSDTSDVLLFTLRAVVKLVRQVASP